MIYEEEPGPICEFGDDHLEGICPECEAIYLGWNSRAEMMKNYVGW